MARVSRKVTITTPIRLGMAVSRRLPMTLNILPPRSTLHEGAIIEPAMEPVLITGHVLLHRDVDVGLIQRDARNVGVGELDELRDILVVARLVAAGGCGDGAVDIAVHLLRLIAHGVEDRILAVIAPDEEVFGI